MKEQYIEPSLEIVALMASGNILTGSNEGFGIDPLDPDFNAPLLDDPELLLF